MLIGSLSFDGDNFGDPNVYDVDWENDWNAIGQEDLKDLFMVWSPEEEKFEVHPFNKDQFPILCGQEWVIVQGQ